ncbi:hypothetical protein GCM10009550_00010 [Actinocorallia libanotica]|uniref:Uncharacterized protein n=1 Tax=Actinocorallia libanotica TaxID=46162 RepID=A0ABP4ADT0_9ACTN
MAGDERRQVLGQRPQLLPRLDVQLLTGDLLGDHRVVIGRALRVPVLPGAVATALAPLLTTLPEPLLGRRPPLSAELAPLPGPPPVVLTELTALALRAVITTELTTLTGLATVIATAEATVILAEVTTLTALGAVVLTEVTALAGLAAVVTTAEALVVAAEVTPLARLRAVVATAEPTVVLTELATLALRTVITAKAAVILAEVTTLALRTVITTLAGLGAVITAAEAAVVLAEVATLALRTVIAAEVAALTGLGAVVTAEVAALARLGAVVTTAEATVVLTELAAFAGLTAIVAAAEALVVTAEVTPLAGSTPVITAEAAVVLTEVTTLAALGAVVLAEVAAFTALRTVITTELAAFAGLAAIVATAEALVVTAEITPLARLRAVVTAAEATVVLTEVTTLTALGAVVLAEVAALAGLPRVTAVEGTSPFIARLGFSETVLRAFAGLALPAAGALSRTRRLRPTLSSGPRLERLTGTRLTRRPAVPTASVRALLPLTSLAVVAAAFLFLHLYMVDGTRRPSDANAVPARKGKPPENPGFLSPSEPPSGRIAVLSSAALGRPPAPFPAPRRTHPPRSAPRRSAGPRAESPHRPDAPRSAPGGDETFPTFTIAFHGKPGGGKSLRKCERLQNAERPRTMSGAFHTLIAAVTYSPTQSPMQYHRRWRA